MNFYAIGFVALLGVVGLGVDYHQQSVKAEVPLGQLSVSGYYDTITARIEGVKAEKLADKAEAERKAAWKAGAKPFLPEAPAGWARRGFDEGDNTQIIPVQRLKSTPNSHPASNYLANSKLAPGQTLENTKPAAGIAALMGERNAADVIRDTANFSAVYENGQETVYLEITFANPPRLNSLAGNVAATLKGSFKDFAGENVGFAVVGGVGYTEAMDGGKKRANHYRILQGRIGFGQEISIRLHANASTASTREILQAIDYDALNALLVTPMASVGNEVTPPPGADEVALAETMREIRGEFDRLISREAAYRMKYINAGALVINTMAQGYGLGDDVVDLTGGQRISMEGLIRTSYRMAMSDLMAGNDAELTVTQAQETLRDAMRGHQSELAAARGAAGPGEAAEMSPELAAELGVDPSGREAQPVLSDEQKARIAVRLMNIMAKDNKTVRANMAAAAARQHETEKGLPPESCVLIDAPGEAFFKCSTSAAQADTRAAPAAGLSVAVAGRTAKGYVSTPIDFSQAPKDMQQNGMAREIGLMLAAKKFEDKLGLPRGSCTFNSKKSRLECNPENAKSEASAQLAQPVKKAEVRRLGGTKRKSAGCGAGQFCSVSPSE